MRLAMIALLAAAAAAAGPASAASVAEEARAWRQAHEREILDQLAGLVRLRSVAADPAGLAATAGRLRESLAARGFEARLLDVGDGAPPAVFASLRSPGATRTVVFYAHYDGQPVTPADWSSDPFEPVLRASPDPAAPALDWRGGAPLAPEARLFGRAASDDKSSIVAFLSAFDALKAAGRAPSVNIKVLWEGEEERGSPHLEALLRQNRELFSADLWLIGDAPVHQSGARMLYFGARGTMGLEATVYGPLRALHDGHYGNWVPNPAARAAELIGQMRGPDGRILIPGFDQDVRPLTTPERQAIAALPRAEPALMRDFGIAAAESAEGLTLATMRPSINVRGVRSGQVGAAAANAIPVDAQVSIDFRLVPGQTPEGVRSKVEAFLRAKGWTLVETAPDAAQRAAHDRLVRLQWGDGYPALRSDMASPAARAVIAAAGRAGEGGLALLPMMGGSVPIYLFAEVFGAPVIGLPIANYDNNQHAANENLRLQNLWDGVETYAAMMADLRW